MTALKLVDRATAGQMLTPLIHGLGLDQPVLVGVGAGGLAVATEIAKGVRAEIDQLAVREVYLDDPTHPPMYVGAVSGSGRVVIHPDAAARLDSQPGRLEAAVAQAWQDIEDSPAQADGLESVPGREVVVVDDGTSELTLLKAAIEVVRAAGPAHLTMAVPMAPQEVLDELATLADSVVCAEAVSWFPWFRLHGHLYDSNETIGEIPPESGPTGRPA